MLTSRSLDPGKTFLPDLIEQHGRLHVAQAILRDLPVTALGQKMVHVHAGHAMALRRFDAERLAIKIQVEPPRGAVAAADAVKGQLLREIAVRFGLIAVPEP